MYNMASDPKIRLNLLEKWYGTLTNATPCEKRLAAILKENRERENLSPSPKDVGAGKHIRRKTKRRNAKKNKTLRRKRNRNVH